MNVTIIVEFVYIVNAGNVAFFKAMFNVTTRVDALRFHWFAKNQIKFEGNTLEMYLNDHNSHSNSDEDDVVGTQGIVDGVITPLLRMTSLILF